MFVLTTRVEDLVVQDKSSLVQSPMVGFMGSTLVNESLLSGGEILSPLAVTTRVRALSEGDQDARHVDQVGCARRSLPGPGWVS